MNWWVIAMFIDIFCVWSLETNHKSEFVLHPHNILHYPFLIWWFSVYQVKVWCTKQEASVLNIDMKANICCVKYNPGSSVHVAVCCHLYWDLISFCWITLKEHHSVVCRLALLIITFTTLIWDTPVLQYMFSEDIEKQSPMWSFCLTMNLHLHQQTVHCACGMWRRITRYIFFYLAICNFILITVVACSISLIQSISLTEPYHSNLCNLRANHEDMHNETYLMITAMYLEQFLFNQFPCWV